MNSFLSFVLKALKIFIDGDLTFPCLKAFAFQHYIKLYCRVGSFILFYFPVFILSVSGLQEVNQTNETVFSYFRKYMYFPLFKI